MISMLVSSNSIQSLTRIAMMKSILYFAVTSLSIKMTAMFPAVIQSPVCMIVTDKMITIIHYCCSKSKIETLNVGRTPKIAHPSR